MSSDSPPTRRLEVQAGRSLSEKFHSFRNLLNLNHSVLKLISDMEVKAGEEYLFDLNYINSCMDEIRVGITGIIDNLVALGGRKYLALYDRLKAINHKTRRILPGSGSIQPDDFTIPYRGLKKNRAWSVGGKNARLGELKADLELPVPRGFAISAWAYKKFLDDNDLQHRISRRIESLNIQRYDDLVKISAEIQAMIIAGEVPAELAEAIESSRRDLEDCGDIFSYSLRSSAIGEDSQFSFAGQYATFLNVHGDDIIEKYKLVVASKFTPKAIYYFLSHSLNESELAMSVGCMEMLNAVSSGVVYTRDPINPNDDCLLISSIWGLGRYLVDGVLTPDEIRVSRIDRGVKSFRIADKPVRLIIDQREGTIKDEVPLAQRRALSLTEAQIKELTEYCLKIEDYYRNPQDIEWVVDVYGRMFILQARPLRLIHLQQSEPAAPVLSESIMQGGETVCPGAGAGEVYYLHSLEDLPEVPPGVVLVAQHSFPGLVTVMERINALMIEVGGVASHMATLAREFRLPTITGLSDLNDRLPLGQPVTVDATNRTVYSGCHEELVQQRRTEGRLFDDIAVVKILQKLLEHISPLNLINPDAEDFLPENCLTVHDITRFAHQTAMTEMFEAARKSEHLEVISHRLKTSIPLQVNIVMIEEDSSALRASSADAGSDMEEASLIDENTIPSQPMQAFWSGVLAEGWPSVGPPPKDEEGRSFTSLATTRFHKDDGRSFEESSYAVLAQDYMALSLRLGYHFTTVEAVCTNEVSKNFIRMQHKGGGAVLDRRVNRVLLLNTILARLGFKIDSRGDFLDALLPYQSPDAVLRVLTIIGRLTMRTKQLDMALINKDLTLWWAEDLMKQLGIVRSADVAS